MAQLYPKPVCDLMRDMAVEMNLQPGQVLDRGQVHQWFHAHYPLVKRATITAHLSRMSTNDPNRLHHRLRPEGLDDLFVKLDTNRFRLYEPGRDPAPITPDSAASGADLEAEDEVVAAEAERASSEFAYEHDLRDYLAANLGLIEPGLTLYFDEDGREGVEFNAGGRFIDLLAVDREGGYVVVELKVSKGYDRTVGQLLRYMGWIERFHADPGQRVRGVIVAKEISDDLRLACSRVKEVQLFEYALSVSLTPVAA